MATRTEAIGNAVSDSLGHFQRWQARHRIGQLQERARALSASTQERHGVAELIAGGHWGALDWLCDELDRGEDRLA